MDESVEQPRRSPLRAALRVAVVVGIAALVALLAWSTLAAGKGRSLVTMIAEGERPSAPAFSLEVIWPRTDTWPLELRAVLDDGQLALDELRGLPVVINVWASWCIPCREEAPILAASARAHQGEVVFVGVDVQDLRPDALAFLRELDVPYVAVRDSSNDTYDAYGLTGVPETYYLDAEGRLIAHSPGVISRASLEEGIAAAQNPGAGT